jgi:hypothetical protein
MTKKNLDLGMIPDPDTSWVCDFKNKIHGNLEAPNKSYKSSEIS